MLPETPTLPHHIQSPTKDMIRIQSVHGSKATQAFGRGAPGYCSILYPCDNMVEVNETSLPCSTETPFKGRIWISKVKLREEMEKHPESWLGRLGLISILLRQEPGGRLGTDQEYLKSLREQALMADGCAILWPFLFLSYCLGFAELAWKTSSFSGD